jgi:hypothetical protein
LGKRVTWWVVTPARVLEPAVPVGEVPDDPGTGLGDPPVWLLPALGVLAVGRGTGPPPPPAGLADGDGTGVGTVRVMFVRIVVRQVSRTPPPLPVPLHWLTRIGISGLTCEAPTLQTAVDPPPVTEPLH